MSEEFVSIVQINDLFTDNYNQNVNRKQNIKKEKVLKMGIEELDLEVRSYNCLKRADIHTIEDLVNKTEKEIIKVKYLEKRSLEEIQYQLAKLGLALRSSHG
ncbi:DNA-directed RNA polymerase subunit alpha C-terminal domain-containing protein [Lachnospiraceae bacterium 46-61]